MTTEINREQWLKALGEAECVEDPDALTREELEGVFNLGPSATKQRLRQLVRDGKAVQVWKRIRDASGRMQRVPAYRLVE